MNTYNISTNAENNLGLKPMDNMKTEVQRIQFDDFSIEADAHGLIPIHSEHGDVRCHLSFLVKTSYRHV